VSVPNIPRSLGIIQPIIFAIFIIGSRLILRYYFRNIDENFRRDNFLDCAVIYGAGSSGRQLANGINQSGEMKIFGYLDDDTALHGQNINGLPVLNPNSLTANWFSNNNITHVLLALPSISITRRREIAIVMKNFSVNVMVLPRLTDLSNGKIRISDFKEVEIDDLLGRTVAPPNLSSYSNDIAGKVILVTGGGGSIGSEICRQIICIRPSRLILLDSSEFALYSITSEIQSYIDDCKLESDILVPVLGSVQNELLMAKTIKNFKPDIIFHAAAYKHVNLVEINELESFCNNIFGTLTVAKQAYENHVPRFVLISTDKAVRPISIMGVSKRIAEMGVQALAEKVRKNNLSTIFSIVRFGNVLGSSGSVVPLFKKQISLGGPVTITHEEATRFFMTIYEASQLVIYASLMAKGGEVFLLDMGERVKILDLAHKMINLMGLTVRDEDNPNGEIEIKIVGLRPGEKLHEELLICDNPETTDHASVMMARENFLDWDIYSIEINRMKIAIENEDVAIAKKIAFDLVIN
jgi:FlaA1/EpsC-like NDP-sugar epimerase